MGTAPAKQQKEATTWADAAGTEHNNWRKPKQRPDVATAPQAKPPGAVSHTPTEALYPPKAPRPAALSSPRAGPPGVGAGGAGPTGFAARSPKASAAAAGGTKAGKSLAAPTSARGEQDGLGSPGPSADEDAGMRSWPMLPNMVQQEEDMEENISSLQGSIDKAWKELTAVVHGSKKQMTSLFTLTETKEHVNTAKEKERQLQRQAALVAASMDEKVKALTSQSRRTEEKYARGIGAGTRHTAMWKPGDIGLRSKGASGLAEILKVYPGVSPPCCELRMLISGQVLNAEMRTMLAIAPPEEKTLKELRDSVEQVRKELAKAKEDQANAQSQLRQEQLIFLERVEAALRREREAQNASCTSPSGGKASPPGPSGLPALDRIEHWGAYVPAIAVTDTPKQGGVSSTASTTMGTGTGTNYGTVQSATDVHSAYQAGAGSGQWQPQDPLQQFQLQQQQIEQQQQQEQQQRQQQHLELQQQEQQRREQQQREREQREQQKREEQQREWQLREQLQREQLQREQQLREQQQQREQQQREQQQREQQQQQEQQQREQQQIWQQQQQQQQQQQMPQPQFQPRQQPQAQTQPNQHPQAQFQQPFEPQQPHPAARTAQVATDVCECGSRFAEDAAFCGKCGRKRPPPKVLSTQCSTCGSQFQPDALFCSKCGQKRAEAGPAPQGAPMQQAAAMPPGADPWAGWQQQQQQQQQGGDPQAMAYDQEQYAQWWTQYNAWYQQQQQQQQYQAEAAAAAAAASAVPPHGVPQPMAQPGAAPGGAAGPDSWAGGMQQGEQQFMDFGGDEWAQWFTDYCAWFQQQSQAKDEGGPPKLAPPASDATVEQKTAFATKTSILQELMAIVESGAPVPDRRKTLRNLQVRWHPDKNADKLAVAKEVFQFLGESRKWFLGADDDGSPWSGCTPRSSIHSPK